jgi:hypothetical protein
MKTAARFGGLLPAGGFAKARIIVLLLENIKNNGEVVAVVIST